MKMVRRLKVVRQSAICLKTPLVNAELFYLRLNVTALADYHLNIQNRVPRRVPSAPRRREITQ